jgi:hypothetical protein
MNNFQLILSQVNETLHSLPDWNNLEKFVSEFHNIWLKLGNFVQQQLVQERIDEKETEYQCPRTKREKRYYTPLGEMVVKRRAYATSDGVKVKVDEGVNEKRCGKGEYVSVNNTITKLKVGFKITRWFC